MVAEVPSPHLHPAKRCQSLSTGLLIGDLHLTCGPVSLFILSYVDFITWVFFASYIYPENSQIQPLSFKCHGFLKNEQNILETDWCFGSTMMDLGGVSTLLLLLARVVELRMDDNNVAAALNILLSAVSSSHDIQKVMK